MLVGSNEVEFEGTGLASLFEVFSSGWFFIELTSLACSSLCDFSLWILFEKFGLFFKSCSWTTLGILFCIFIGFSLSLIPTIAKFSSVSEVTIFVIFDGKTDLEKNKKKI